MPSLRCPRCSNVVSVAPGESPTCPRCGFGRSEAPIVGSAVEPSYAAPIEASYVPEARPYEPPPSAGRRGPKVAIVIVAAVLLLGGAIGAAFFLGNLSHAKGGSITEAQLKTALASIRDGSVAKTDDGSDAAFGILATMTGSGMGGGFGTSGSMDLRILFDPANQAYEMSYKGGGGGVTIDLGVKQKGTTINYLQSGTVLEGRDEDPTTLPDFGDMRELQGGGDSGGAPFDSLFDDQGAIDGREGTTYKGKAATKFFIHDPASPEDKGEIIVYDATKKVAWMKMTSQEMTAEMQMVYGKDVKVNTVHSERRASVAVGEGPFGFGGAFAATCMPDSSAGPTGAYHCSVPERQAQEVKLSELELRMPWDAGSQQGSPRASLRLDQGSKSENGVTLRYDDVDQDGLFSGNDTYSFKIPPEEDHGFSSVTLYDLWADAPAGGPSFPMPGFEGVLLVGALAIGAVVFGRRRQG